MIEYIIIIIASVIGLFISALLLWLSAKIFKQKLSYGKSLGPAAIVVVSGLFFSLIGLIDPIINIITSILGMLVGLALFLTLPSLLLKMEWNKGLLVGLVWMVFSFVLGLILMVIGGVIVALVLGSAMSNMMTGFATLFA